nr:GNAT family N-acetyltransferase [uncultured Chryseobacterium sp.]
MIRKIEAADYPCLMKIWESAVLHTHDFLKEEDFIYYKENIPLYFEHVSLLGFEEKNKLVGFMGIAEGNLEMLFIHNDFRGKGIGKRLITYGIDHLAVNKVDVNEQNIQAVGFYTYIGFTILKRSALDGQGKEYPILHMGLSPVEK